LNDEAASLDWTKSSGHVLSGRKIFDSYGDEFVLEPEADAVGHKLGGGSSSLANARVLSGVAAYQRLLNASSPELESSHNKVATSVKRTDPVHDGQDFGQGDVKAEPDPDDSDAITTVTSGSPGFMLFTAQNTKGYSELDLDAKKTSVNFVEPDPDESSDAATLNNVMEIDGEHDKEPDPDDATSDFFLESGNKMEVETQLRTNTTVLKSEPDPEVSTDGHMGEPDPDASSCGAVLESGNKIEEVIEHSRNPSVLKSEPDPDDHTADLNINELQRIEEPVAALCSRLQKAIEMLRLQATPSEAASALQTLFKIIKNVIENPNDIRYKRLRKVCLVSLHCSVFFSTETNHRFFPIL
jgi:hypothetical protein